ncbi:hypothetical protein JCM11641_002255 [Rhodosporidiobolus odoratus]
MEAPAPGQEASSSSSQQPQDDTAARTSRLAGTEASSHSPSLVKNGLNGASTSAATLPTSSTPAATSASVDDAKLKLRPLPSTNSSSGASSGANGGSGAEQTMYGAAKPNEAPSPLPSASAAQPSQVGKSAQDASGKGEDGRTSTKGEANGVQRQVEGAAASGTGGKAAAAESADVTMEEAPTAERQMSVETRENTPALSDTLSDTASVATSAAGSTPAEPASDNMAVDSTTNGELPFPLSAYSFANTTLVPMGSTSTTPFNFQNFPYQVLEESWNRSKRSDDPEAYELFDREPGFFATKEELAASKEREEARLARVKSRLAKLERIRRGEPEEPPAPAPAPLPPSRSGSKSRAMERGGSAEGQPYIPPRRGRPPKSSLQQQVKAAAPASPPEAAAPTPAPAPAKAPPAPKAAPKTAPKSAPKPAPKPAEPTPPPVPKGPPPSRFNRKLVDALLPDDAQTAVPVFFESHPSFIDLYALPPHYLPDGPLPTLAKPASPPSAASTSQTAPSTSQANADQPPPAAAPPYGSRSASRDSLAAASVSRASAAAPAADKQEPGTGDVEMQANTAKRSRPAEDDGRTSGRKRAREAAAEPVAVAPPTADPPLGAIVAYTVQSTTCLSKKVDGQNRCFQCIARNIGQNCSFLGIRSFGFDSLNRIVTPPVFRSIDAPDVKLDFDKTLTKPLNSHDTELIKTWLAPHLNRILKRESAQANQKETIKIRSDPAMLSLCDFCNTSQVGSTWLCQTCGRLACRVCFDVLLDLEKKEQKKTPTTLTSADVHRRKKCVTKRRGKDLTGEEMHRSWQFVPLNTLLKDELKEMSKKVYDWYSTRMLAGTDPKTYAYLRRKFTVPSSLAQYDQNTHSVNTVVHGSLSEPIYFELWRMGEPVLVRKCPKGGLTKFTPEYLAEKCAVHKVELINNYGTEVFPSTGHFFFSQFSKKGFRRADDGQSSFRTKDWPTPKQWQTDLKELADEFYKIVPLPNLLRPDGIYNMLSHAPVNAAQPDLGPRVVASWETNAKWATTHLRTDYFDIASYMWWGGRDKDTNKPLRIRWDVWKAEDADKLREFCFDLLSRKLQRGATAKQYRDSHDDPLLSPQLYLTKSQRLELFNKHGIQSFPIYQFEGDLVLIPAGCPYQVSSWIDHLNISIPFLAGARVGEALNVNKALSYQTNERVWRHDAIHLESQLLWAWKACDAYDKANPSAEPEKPTGPDAKKAKAAETPAEAKSSASSRPTQAPAVPAAATFAKPSAAPSAKPAVPSAKPGAAGSGALPSAAGLPPLPQMPPKRQTIDRAALPGIPFDPKAPLPPRRPSSAAPSAPSPAPSPAAAPVGPAPTPPAPVTVPIKSEAVPSPVPPVNGGSGDTPMAPPPESKP